MPLHVSTVHARNRERSISVAGNDRKVHSASNGMLAQLKRDAACKNVDCIALCQIDLKD